MRNWLLPEHIEDLLPDEAERVERLRRLLLDHFMAQGYRLVQPPLVEHVEALTTGTGRDLELQTFKVVDPLSGRLLGVRSDITPQVARIDAHLLNEPGVTRLCYAGSVLRTLPAGPGTTREVIQLGAELFGEPGIAGDQEAVALLISALDAAGVTRLHLDLGHAAVYRALANAAGVATDGEDNELFIAMRIKDAPGVATLTARLAPAWRAALNALPQLYGPAVEVAGARPCRAPGHPCHRRRTGRPGSHRDHRRTPCGGAAYRSGRPARLSLSQRRDLLKCSPPVKRARSAKAAATMAWARPLAAPVPQPASRSICASWRRSSCERTKGLRRLPWART